MKKSLCILSAALIVASSCSKYEQPMEIETNEVKMVSATISAESSNTGDGTKTVATYDKDTKKYKITWEEGDELSVFNSSTEKPMTKFTAISAGEKTKFNGEIPEGSTISHAIFPYNDKATASGDVVYTSIPAEQSGDFSNIVLAGWEKETKAEVENYDLNYQFEAVCGIVKFSFNPDDIAEGKTITKIVLISDLPISGDAKIDYSDGKPIMTSNPNSSASNVYNAVTLTKPEGFTEGDYYIATFPIKSESQLGIVLRFETSDGYVAYKNAKLKAVGTEGDKHIFAANIVKNIGSVKVTEYLPHGFTEKPFSVSATKQVYFSRGNLQYQASSGTWRFAPNQWDAQGEIGNSTAPNNNTGDEGARANQSEWIDLFPLGHTGWADNDRTYFPYSSYKFETFYSSYVYQTHIQAKDDNRDWGHYCKILNGDIEDPVDTWRILSYEEWYYLLCLGASDPGDTQYTSGRYAKVTTDAGSEGQATKRRLVFMKIGVKTGVFIGGNEVIRYGLLLFPDGFTWPNAITKPSMNRYSKKTDDFWPTERVQGYKPAQMYSLTDLAIFEQSGCVFLPAAGRRSAAGGAAPISIEFFNESAYYWTTSPVGWSNHLAVYGRNLDMETANFTHARAVRLVKDVKDVTADN